MNEKALVPAETGQSQQIQQPTQQSTSLFQRFADPMKAIEQMGAFISESGMFGKMNKQQGSVLAWHCLTKNKDPFEFKREFHILEDGQITKRSDSMAADFIRHGGKIKWISDLNDDQEAKATFITRDGDSYTWAFSMKDAKGYSDTRDGFLKKNWRDSTPDMLRARLLSKSIRILDPEVNAGVYTPEELRESQAAQLPPAATGLFDRQTQPDAPQTTQTDGPVQTTATVIDSKPVNPQTPQETNKPEPQPKTQPEKPKELSPKEMLDEIIEKFKGFNSVTVDRFFQLKKWLPEGSALSDLDEAHIRRLHKTIDQIIPIYRAWEKQQEELAKNSTGGKK
jgi:hypothetical protein